MNIAKLEVDLKAVFPDCRYVLQEVRPYFEYSDGKKTENLLGYKFHIVEDLNFEHFDVKIPCKTPAITQEQIDASKNRVYVDFEEARVKFYKTPDGRIDISVTAKAINLVRSTGTSTT